MKIILISGVADPDEIRDLLAVGADEFIKKPFQIDQFISKMAELVNA